MSKLRYRDICRNGDGFGMKEEGGKAKAGVGNDLPIFEFFPPLFHRFRLNFANMGKLGKGEHLSLEAYKYKENNMSW